MNVRLDNLVSAHAGLWRDDGWYRLSWLVWPQAVSLLMAGWLLIGGGAQVPAGAAAPWSKPVD